VLDVPEVELDALRPRQGRPALDLRPARDARQDGEPAALALRVLVDLDLDGRPRADEGHLPAQDVHEVRQLVDRRAPQERADARDPVVALVDGEPGAHALGARDHRPELVDLEGAPVLAHAPLAVDRMPGRLEADEQGGDPQDRGGGGQRGARHRDVERPLAPVAHRVPSAGSQPAGVPWRSQS
jgi:hypothetical protein